MLVEFSKMFVAWREKWWNICSRGRFSEGPEAAKKMFYLHLYSVLLLSSEKLLFGYKTCEVWLDCEKQMQNAIGLDFASSCFLPKFGITSQFTWFCGFFIKSPICFEAILQQDKLQYFSPKKRSTMPPWQVVLWFGLKKQPGCEAPFFFGGGAKPQENQKVPKTRVFYIVFLSCIRA